MHFSMYSTCDTILNHAYIYIIYIYHLSYIIYHIYMHILCYVWFKCILFSSFLYILICWPDFRSLRRFPHLSGFSRRQSVATTGKVTPSQEAESRESHEGTKAACNWATWRFIDFHIPSLKIDGFLMVKWWMIWVIPSMKLTVRTWKWMIGRWISFWDGQFSGTIC